MNKSSPGLVALFVSAAVFAGGDPLDDPHVSLVAAYAIPIALKQFRKDQPQASQKHFVVYVRESERSVEVAFVPEPTPMDKKCDEKDCVITMGAGGETIYGFGITYVIDKLKYRITETIRAR